VPRPAHRGGGAGDASRRTYGAENECARRGEGARIGVARGIGERGVDRGLEGLVRLCANDGLIANKEGRGGADANAHAAAIIGFDQRLGVTAVDAGAEARAIDAEVGGEGIEVGGGIAAALPEALGIEDGIGGGPELVLFGGAHGEFVCGLRVAMRRDGEVQVGDADLARLDVLAIEARGGFIVPALAEGAFEVGDDDEPEVGGGASLDAAGIGAGDEGVAGGVGG
jgi:hypothetical protein